MYMNFCKFRKKERRVRKERYTRGEGYEREKGRGEREREREGESDHDKLYLPVRCSPTGEHRAVAVSAVLPLAGLGEHLSLSPDLPAKV